MRITLVTQKCGTGNGTLTTALAAADARSKLLAFLVLVGLAVASVSELIQSSISCERHRGDFSNDFSPDFDINSVDCRGSWVKNFPTIRIWSTAPYFDIRWPQRVL